MQGSKRKSLMYGLEITGTGNCNTHGMPQNLTMCT